MTTSNIEKFNLAPVKKRICELRHRLRLCILKLSGPGFIKHPRNKERVAQFTEFIKPVSKFYDEGKLPYCPASSLSQSKNLDAYIIRQLFLIFKDWGSLPYIKQGQAALTLLHKIDRQLRLLEAIVKYGVGSFRIKGSVENGYKLARK